MVTHNYFCFLYTSSVAVVTMYTCMYQTTHLLRPNLLGKMLVPVMLLSTLPSHRYYFCESGVNSGYPRQVFYQEDPLWDGEGCGSSSSCCSFNNPPYFTKTLPSPTSDPIEARLCWLDIHGSPIEFIELYVK